MELLLAVAEIHRHGLAHRDIKTANIVMMPVKAYQNPVAMLCDFGIVRELADSELCQTAVGTPYYMSP